MRYSKCGKNIKESFTIIHNRSNNGILIIVVRPSKEISTIKKTTV
jgi:hypothetical protein